MVGAAAYLATVRGVLAPLSDFGESLEKQKLTEKTRRKRNLGTGIQFII